MKLKHDFSSNAQNALLLSFQQQYGEGTVLNFEEAELSFLLDYHSTIGNSKQAKVIGENIINQFPYSPVLLGELAQFYLSCGNYSDAVEYAQKAYNLSPKDFHILSLYLSCLLKNHDTDEVISLTEIFYRSTDHHEKVELLMARAEAYSILKNQFELVDSINKAAALAGNDSYLIQKIASKLFTFRQKDLSIPFLQKAVDNNPYDGKLWFYLGNALEYDGRDFDAAFAYCYAYENQPDNKEAYLRAAHIYIEKNNISSAYKCLTDAKDYFGVCDEIFTLLSKCYLISNQVESAIQYLSDGLKLNPESGELHFLMAKAQYKLGKIANAKQSAKRAVDLDPEMDDYHFLLGKIHYELNEWMEAYSCFRHLAHHACESSFYILHFANFLMEIECFTEAWEELEIAAENFNSLEVVLYQVICLLQLNKPKDAKLFLRNNLIQFFHNNDPIHSLPFESMKDEDIINLLSSLTKSQNN